MNKKEIEQKVLQCCRKVCLGYRHVPQDDDENWQKRSLYGDIDMDSLDIVEFAMELEKEFHITKEIHLENAETLEDVVNIVEKLLSEE